MLSCVSGLSMYCTSGVFFKQKSKKKFASSQAEKSGYHKKKLKLDFFWSCTGIFVQYKNIEIEMNVVVFLAQVFQEGYKNLIKSFTCFDV